MKSVFITGTDTGVGKTVLSGTLLSLARANNADAVPMKPVQTGCEERDGRLVAPDLEHCLQAAGLEPGESERALMCPYRFTPACSPHLAAAKAGESIDIGRIVEAYTELAARHKTVVVEGAGGILVPISRSETMLDIMRALSLPVILAARPGLGTLNHTLLSVSVLHAVGVEITAVVFVDTEERKWSDVERDNLDTVSEFANVSVCHLPYLEDVRSTAVEPVVRNGLKELIE